MATGAAPATRDSDDAAFRGRWRSGAKLQLNPIQSAALDAFSEQGYHGTTVRDIARRVGVTVPALYYHYENKEGMLFALLDRSIDRLNGVCEQAVAEAGADVAQQFLNVVEAIVRYMAHSTKLASLDPEIRALNPDHRAAYAAKRRRIEERLVAVVEQGRDEGSFDVVSPRDAARALLGMFQAIALWYRPGGRTTPTALAATYVDLAAHAVGATPTVIARARSVGDR
jgi:AcrR family transcriptional regulator